MVKTASMFVQVWFCCFLFEGLQLRSSAFVDWCVRCLEKEKILSAWSLRFHWQRASVKNRISDHLKMGDRSLFGWRGWEAMDFNVETLRKFRIDVFIMYV